MIKKRLNQIRTLIVDAVLFIRMKFEKVHHSSATPIILEFTFPNLYHRYFYTLIKTLELGGYQIFYPMSFTKFRNLRNGDVYLALMFKQPRIININNPKNIKNAIVLRDNMFSANYYKTYFKDHNQSQNSYHIPMCFHPYMYSNNIWQQPLDEGDTLRINALYSFGNFDRQAYKTIHKSPFGIIDRASLIDFFSKKSNFISPRTLQDLQKIIQEKKSHQFIFVEKYNFGIPMDKVQVYLSKFRYFLCCPGVFAPLSHNFVEALSASCIPVIEKSYADCIYPPLEHKVNAFIFKDLLDLEYLLENEIFTLSDEEYLEMKANVKNYYNSYLHPKAAAINLINNLDKYPIYLNASEQSIKLLNHYKHE